MISQQSYFTGLRSELTGIPLNDAIYESLLLFRVEPSHSWETHSKPTKPVSVNYPDYKDIHLAWYVFTHVINIMQSRQTYSQTVCQTFSEKKVCTLPPSGWDTCRCDGRREDASTRDSAS